MSDGFIGVVYVNGMSGVCDVCILYVVHAWWICLQHMCNVL